MGIRDVLAVCLCVACCVQAGSAAADDTAGILRLASKELKKLSLEELMDVEVYSASRHLEPVQTAPNAIFVLTADDLRRSRVTTVPDALRLVPGVQVGRVDANKYAVSMRGFNSREANKLLILVDGRSIYDPLFSGMLWESQDFLMEDIDRIEVIRGPGGTLWGANAFNGVVNIITKHARDTQGAFATATGGTEEIYTAAARYGWQPAPHQSARVYAKSMQRDTGFLSVAEPYDATRHLRGGFRWDFSSGAGDELRLSGDVFKATTGTRELLSSVQDTEHRGRNAILSWNRQTATRGALRAQFYYDSVGYDSASFDQQRKTYDLELQHSFAAGARHFLVWGGGYRRLSDHTESAFAGFVDVLPLRRKDELSNLFVQDTITLVPERWRLIAGLKYESTDYADAEWLPNLRLSWTPSAQQSWWAAVSQATRVPSRLESDLTFFSAIAPIRIGDNLESEHVRAYEVGQRLLITPQLWYDVALFYNDYTDLATGEAGGQLRNFMHGHTYGTEVALRWEPMASWRLDLAYTYLRMGLELDPVSTSPASRPAFIEGLASRHQIVLRSAVDLPRNLQLDATLRYVDKLTSIGFPAYTELDLGVSWFARPQLEFALVGQNLLDPHHPEQIFASSSTGMSTEVERGVYGKVVWSF